MQTTLFPLLLLLSLSVPFTALADEQTAELPDPHLYELVSEALANNSELLAAKSRREMFAQKVSPARSLNDPRLSFGLLNYPVNSLASDETAMTGNDVRLEQAFPFPGKLALKGKVASQQAAWYEALYLEQRTEVVRQVRDHWYRLYSLEHALKLVRSNLEAAEQLIRLSETRYAVGQGLQQDVLKAQLQRSRLMDREFTLVRDQKVLQASLSSLLNRSAGSMVTPPEALSHQLVLPDLPGAIANLEHSRHLFSAYQALIDQYQAQKGLARKEFYPDFGVWAGYRFRDDSLADGGEDFVSAGVSINLPIYREKRHAKAADAEAGLAMARHQYQQLLTRTISELQDSHARLIRNRDRVLLFETGIIPQAQQAFDAGLRAYQVGKISFKELIDSLMSLYSYQIDFHRALSDFHQAQARFEQLAGIAEYLPGPQEDNRE